MLLLGAMDAKQRVAAFLLSLSKRYQRLGYAANRFSLRMTREEIGSYLGVALATVSRLLSRLQTEGMISINQREVELKDVERLASSSRINWRVPRRTFPRFRTAGDAAGNC